MIHITLSPRHRALPDDGLGRQWVGYDPTRSEQDNYEANHGEWVIGRRRLNERYTIFSFGGVVVQALKNERFEITNERQPGDSRDDRYTIHGPILRPGHPVYDKYVGKASPLRQRNPVGYLADPEVEVTTCRCGCGEPSAREFLPGHDQRAIHERIARIGTVSQFLDWFDDQFENA